LRSFQGRSSFSTWLTRIVINAALMVRRKRTAHYEPSLDEILEMQPNRLAHTTIDERADPEKQCAAAEINVLIEDQVRQLSPEMQEAFRFRVQNNFSIKEATRVLGISPSTFKSRTCRARLKVAEGLRNSVKKVSADLPDWI
jgi:RNA polymerase sigma-70 factor (ECF subfamily)